MIGKTCKEGMLQIFLKMRQKQNPVATNLLILRVRVDAKPHYVIYSSPWFDILIFGKI